MPVVSFNHVRQYQASYQHESPDFGVQEQTVDFWMHDRALQGDTVVLAHPGFATAPSTIRRMVGRLAHLPLAGVNLTFPDPRPEGIETTIRAGSAAVRQKILDIRRRDTNFIAAGHSIGAGIALKEVDTTPEAYNGLVLVASFGLTNEPMPELPEPKAYDIIKERRQELMAGINRNKRRLRPSKTDEVSKDPAEIAGLPLLDEPKIQREELTTRLEWAVIQDGAAMLKRWVQETQATRRTVVAPALEDPIFEFPAVMRRIGYLAGTHGFEILPVEGGHLPWTAPKSGMQFSLAIERAMALPSPNGRRS